MADADVQLTAELDATGVDAALNHIIKRVGQMEKSSDKNMKKMGKHVGGVTAELQIQLAKYEALEKKGTISDEQKKSFKEMREDILKSVDALEALIARLHQAEKITIKQDFGIERKSRKEIRGGLEGTIGGARAAILKGDLEQELKTAEGGLKNSINRMLADLERLGKDPTLEGSDFNRSVGNLISKFDRLKKGIKDTEQQARDLQKVGGEPRVESRETRAFDEVEKDAEDLKDKLIGIMDNSEGHIHESAKVIREDLEKMMKGPKMEAEEYAKELNDLEGEIDDIISKEKEREKVNVGAGARGIGGRRDVVRGERQKIFAEAGGEDLERQVDRLMKNAEDRVVAGASTIKGQMEGLLSGPVQPPDEVLKIIQELQREADKLEKLKPIDVVKSDELDQADLLRTKLKKLAQVADEVAKAGDSEELKSIQHLQEKAGLIEEEAELGSITNKQAVKDVNDLIGQANEHARVLKKATKETEAVAEATEDVANAVDEIEPINKKLDAKKALNTFKANTKDIESLLKSTNAEVRGIAKELDKLGKEAKDSFDQGTSSAENFLKIQNKVKGAVRDTANAFGEDIPSAQGRATVSTWKLGNAMDRVGVRGVGGAVRIADAFRGIPPAAIAGVVAIAGIVAITVKLIEKLVELGAQAAKAFAEFVKGAVESSRDIEITDRQLGALVRNPDLGKGFRNLLLDESFEVGLNLTGDFARVLVPLAKDVEEIEKAAEIAATLAHAFQETDEAIANAIKQAAGGHFRPLIERFGLTEFEIDKIKKAQDRVGEFTGVLEGLQSALDRRGLNLEGTFGGTLQKLLGQLSVLREQINITVGEPVRDDLAVQLEKLFSLVESRKDSLLGFFEGLGETIGGVITSAGELIRGLIGDVSDADLDSLSVEVSDLGDAISEAVDNLRMLLSSDDRSVIDVMIDLTESVAGLTENLASLLQIFEGFTNLKRDVEGAKIPFTDLDIKAASEAAKAGAGALTAGPALIPKGIGFLGKGLSEEGLSDEEIKEFNHELQLAIPGVGSFIAVVDSLKGANEENADATDALTLAQDGLTTSTQKLTEAELAELDVAVQRGHRLEQLEQLSLAAADAQEKITKAEEKLARDRALQEGQIRTRFDRQEIDQDIRRSEQREDLFKKHMNSLLKLTDDLNFRISESGIQFDQKEEDLGQKHTDKLEDIDRKSTEKKIDIEKKFRDRLKDIRAKFDLDAEEAIRRNDAVGLLRIRRRMQLELEQAKTQRDRQVEEADDSAEKAREEAKIQLERGIRDNDLAEKRKLQDIMRADEQRRAQLIDQYNFEHAQIDVQYRRRRAAIEENERRAIDDLNNSFDKRNEDLAAALETDFKTVEEWKNAETEFMRLTVIAQAAILRAQRELWLREGTLFRHLMESNFGFGSTGVTFVEPSSGGLSDRDEGSGGASVNADVEDPVGSGFRKQHGGFVVPGNVYGINERGTEAFYTTRAGIIQSRGSLLESPFLNRASMTNIDNSRTIQADINTTDPTHMSPIQRTMIKQLITEEMLSHGV